MMVRRNLILGFFAFSGLAAGLAFLPKSVVSNKPAEVSSEAKPSQDAKSGEKAAEIHNTDPALESEISKFRNEAEESGTAAKKGGSR